jgi:CO/xanthine dehydrogenase Mo-binding subunit
LSEISVVDVSAAIADAICHATGMRVRDMDNGWLRLAAP